MNTVHTTQLKHNFYLLLAADFISSFGSSMTGVALTLFIYSNTDSLMVSALFAVITLLPQLFVSPFLSRLKIRAGFRIIFAAGELLCAIPIIIMLFIDNVILMYIVFFLYSAIFFVLECFRAEYLKVITENDNIQQRQSASRLVNILVTVIGPLAGGALLTQFGIKIIYLCDIVSYIVAALIILFIKGNERPSELESGRTAAHSLEKILENKDIFIGCLLITFVGGAVSILTMEYIYNVIGADAMHYSALMSGMAVGGLIGSALGGMPFARNHLRKISFFSTVFMGLLLLSVLLKPGYTVLLGILVISGILSALVMLYYSVELYIRSNQTEMRGQYAVFQNITDLSSAMSKPFGALLNQWIGCIMSISSLGIVFLIMGAALISKKTDVKANKE